jgi:hypothetical protein
MTVTKYPAVVTRIKEPDWTWERDRSFSIAGSRGAMTILAVMLRKKMEARTRIGPNWARKVEPGSAGTVAGLLTPTPLIHSAVIYQIEGKKTNRLSLTNRMVEVRVAS